MPTNKNSTKKSNETPLQDVQKQNIGDLDLESLILYEKTCRLLSVKYENLVKKYDGSLDYDTDAFLNFDKINNIRLIILDELEKRLTKLTK